MEDINENTKNLYIIKRRLAERRKRPNQPYFDYFVGNFLVKIFPDRIQENNNYGPDDSIVNHNLLDVHLYEYKRDSSGQSFEQYVDLEKDSRFKNYQPIKYSQFTQYSTGKEMPLTHLCELIKYLHRLSNLSAFL
jgi:hypothetical protein